MRAALQALHQSTLACMRVTDPRGFAQSVASRLRVHPANVAHATPTKPAAAAAAFSAASARPPTLRPPKRPSGGMAPGPWASFRRAVVSTVTSRNFAVVLGTSAAAGAGIWASQGHWRPAPQHRNGLSSSSATGAGEAPDRRRVQASFSIGGEEATTLSPENTTMVLISGHSMIPHPDKADRGGEDALFVCERSGCLGVADGVGGWAEVGVDPGLYSRELMERAKAFTALVTPGPDAPQAALEAAHAETKSRGSCTACILCLHSDKVHASNLGDSGFMIVRGEEVAFMSPQQQHDFNFPYQIGSPDSMGDSPTAAQRFVVDVQPGDVIIMATDGVFDNIYPDEAAALVFASKSKGDSPFGAAAAVAEFARTRAADPTHLSPFAYGAQQLGYRFFGGKMDDITVVCAYVESSGSFSAESSGDDAAGGGGGGDSGMPRSKL